MVMVHRDSAIHKCSLSLDDFYSIDEDHSMMVKFAKDDDNYANAVNCIKQAVGPTMTRRSRKIEESTQRTRPLDLLEDAFAEMSADCKEPLENRQCNDWKGEGNYSYQVILGPLNYFMCRVMLKSWPEILRSLGSGVLDRRLQNVSPQFASTFEWVFQNETLDIPHWMQNGSDVYGIHGKPGSGKSTLMKYIFSHPETVAPLDTWAPPGILVKASFVFYYRTHKCRNRFWVWSGVSCLKFLIKSHTSANLYRQTAFQRAEKSRLIGTSSISEVL